MLPCARRTLCLHLQPVDTEPPVRRHLHRGWSVRSLSDLTGQQRAFIGFGFRTDPVHVVFRVVSDDVAPRALTIPNVRNIVIGLLGSKSDLEAIFHLQALNRGANDLAAVRHEMANDGLQPLMTHIIMSGPIKPLTEIERAAAGLKVGYYFAHGELWLSARKTMELLGYDYKNGGALARHALTGRKWRYLRLPHVGEGRRYRAYYAQKDVLMTAERLKQKRK
jgi:hypothetical protein